ncbi:hypothetical protein [Streptomyces aidingensis]|uniref:Nucleopolyhedrovirus P10 family protein n=1 Tax=Streptomyces aidingensis TaxID=910347 RepID=A0A1I1M0T0_9ACTN|nr:hypothetical protein [Streptomyces aidingensis]SFC78835.1 hypothetical protein SAMN05421773_10644 [Streptomyces aidingensis]
MSESEPETETDGTADDGLRAAVRAQLGLGRLLPLGGPQDGVWLAERAAIRVLGEAARELPGVRVTRLRIGPADAGPDGERPAVTPPSTALPPGPLRVAAAFAASAVRPIPASAGLLRDSLTGAAERRLGLRVVAVDLHVTGLLTEDGEGPGEAGEDGWARGTRETREIREIREIRETVSRRGGPQPPPAAAGDGAEARVAGAVRAVPGVLGLSTALAVPGRAVLVRDGEVRLQVRLRAPEADGPATLRTARAVREAAAGAAGGARVAVLITGLG